MRRFLIMFPVMLTACAFATQVSKDVATACSWATPILPILEAAVPATIPGLASVGAACTIDGQVQASLNDTQPVTPTNSGSSGNWVVTTLQKIAADFGVKIPSPPVLSTTPVVPAPT